MRIGLITYHWPANFGANLQALATTRFLRARSHDILVLNYRPPQLIDKYRHTVPPAQLRAHFDFCDQMLPETQPCANTEELIRAARGLQLDAALTGSDAVFRIDYRLNREDTTFPNPFWLDWAVELGLPTASIAASAMGTNFLNLPTPARQGVARALRGMREVTVRDAWTKLMVELVTLGMSRPRLLPDPVFLLDPLDLARASPTKDSACSSRPSRPYVLLSGPRSLFTVDWVESFVHAAHAHGLEVVGLPLPEGELPPGPLDQTVGQPLSPSDWYTWIAQSAGYVGARFHPIVVAMANQVPFIALDLYQRRWWLPWASKTFDMTVRAGLGHRCLSRRSLRRFDGARVLMHLLEHRNVDRVRAQRFCLQARVGYDAFAESLETSRPHDLSMARDD